MSITVAKIRAKFQRRHLATRPVLPATAFVPSTGSLRVKYNTEASWALYGGVTLPQQLGRSVAHGLTPPLRGGVGRPKDGER